MATELITMAEHARRCGVSREAVRKWKDAGRLVMTGDLVDHAASYKGERWHDGAKKARQESGPAKPNRQPGKASSRDQQQEQHPVADAPTAGPSKDAEAAPTGMSALKEAVTRKEEFAGKLRELEFMERAGQLIDLATAQRIFFDEARAARDAWLSFPARYGARIAADLGIDDPGRVASVLSAYIHRQVTALGEPRPEVLEQRT